MKAFFKAAMEGLVTGLALTLGTLLLIAGAASLCFIVASVAAIPFTIAWQSVAEHIPNLYSQIGEISYKGFRAGLFIVLFSLTLLKANYRLK